MKKILSRHIQIHDALLDSLPFFPLLWEPFDNVLKESALERLFFYELARHNVLLTFEKILLKNIVAGFQTVTMAFPSLPGKIELLQSIVNFSVHFINQIGFKKEPFNFYNRLLFEIRHFRFTEKGHWMLRLLIYSF